MLSRAVFRTKMTQAAEPRVILIYIRFLMHYFAQFYCNYYDIMPICM